jgi:hypothetical protein
MILVVKRGDEYTRYELISIEIDEARGLSFFCRDPLGRIVTILPFNDKDRVEWVVTLR